MNINNSKAKMERYNFDVAYLGVNSTFIIYVSIVFTIKNTWVGEITEINIFKLALAGVGMAFYLAILLYIDKNNLKIRKGRFTRN